MIRYLNCFKELKSIKHKFCYECYIKIGNDLNYLINKYKKMRDKQNELLNYKGDL